MSSGPQPGPSPGSDARQVACLLAIDPVGLGGVVLRGPAGECRDEYLQLIRQYQEPGRPWRRVPLSIDDDRLLGGLDVAASLRTGTPVVASGILAEANEGSIILSMAERMERDVAARICAAMDCGEVHVERNGFSRHLAGRFSVIALDEGLGEDELVNFELASRLAFHVDLRALSHDQLDDSPVSQELLEQARALLPKVTVSDEMLQTLNAVALSLGIVSMRSVLLALRACRVAAALAGRNQVAEEDLHTVIRLVLAHRAEQFPSFEDEQQADAESQQQNESPPLEEQDSVDTEQNQKQSKGLPEDLILEAVKAAIPADMLSRLQAAAQRARALGVKSRGGARAQSRHRGRPLGARRAAPRNGQRLNIGATLKAAAPWQRLRQTGHSHRTARFRVLPEDFHLTRFKAHQETTTIFVVDASGSAAAQRLAEAKGAVELLLAQCYVRRDQVALISFRGGTAELLLPPTRALARAKRELSALPGGGGTPLAAGIDAARELAMDLQRKGQTPVVVLMTDGRANICRDGTPGHEQANEEALVSSRLFQAGGWNSVVVDTANRPRPRAKSIADAMGAQYFPMPYAEASSLAGLIHSKTSIQ